MHCTDPTMGRRGALGVLAALAAAAAGCAGRAGRAPAPAPAAPGPAVPPVPAPAAVAPPPSPSPAVPPPRLAPLGPAVALGPAAPARDWNEFKRAAATRMVRASPQGSYLGPVPSLLFGIPVLEIELNADGGLRDVRVMRRPVNEEAADTVALAVEAIRRGAPYGDVSRLPRPWKWTEVFLFDDRRRFKPRTLD
ncbi:MAG: hypothetical protein ACK57B_17380 [Betaproteobacteria bacterium]